MRVAPVSRPARMHISALPTLRVHQPSRATRPALVHHPTEDSPRGFSFRSVASYAGRAIGNLGKVVLILPFVDGLLQRRPATGVTEPPPHTPLEEPPTTTLPLPWAQSAPPLLRQSILVKRTVASAEDTKRRQRHERRGQHMQDQASWAPSKLQVSQRHHMIRRLVWLDTEGQLQRFARTQPWRSGSSLQEHLRSLNRRSPLLQWHVHHNVVPSHLREQSESHRKCLELKKALLEVVPVLWSLVREVQRREPSMAARINRRLARAIASLASWNAGRWLRLSPERQYVAMNNFLRQLVRIVSECQRVLACTSGDDECLLDAVREER